VSTPFDGSQPCAETDPEAFFPEKGGSVHAAKRVCAGCHLREACLDYALTTDFGGYPPSGVWGGSTERERRELRRALAQRPSAA
jgi:WhiB family redox-sensing transcriptional regulator